MNVEDWSLGELTRRLNDLDVRLILLRQVGPGELGSDSIGSWGCTVENYRRSGKALANNYQSGRGLSPGAAIANALEKFIAYRDQPRPKALPRLNLIDLDLEIEL